MNNTFLVIAWHPEPPYTGGSFNCQIKSFQYHQCNKQVKFIIIDKEFSRLEKYSSTNIEMIPYHIPHFINKLRSISYAIGRLAEWVYIIIRIYSISSKLIKNRHINGIYLPIAESNQLTFVASVLSRKFQIPVYAMVHQLGQESNKLHIQLVGILKNNGRLWRKIYATLEAVYIHCLSGGLQKRLREFYKVTTISEASAYKLSILLKRPVEVIPYGFDIQPYLNVQERDKIYDCIYLGRIIESKGIPDLLAVWKLVVRSLPNAKLIIVGDGIKTYINDLKTQIHKQGLESSIVLAGYQEGQSKIRLLKQSKVLLFLSHFESYSDVITEAIASNLGIVCYDLPAYDSRKKYTKFMFTFKQGDYENVAAQVVAMLKKDEFPVQSSSLGSLPSWADFAEKERKFLNGSNS